MALAAEILNPSQPPLVLADCEHFTVALFYQIAQNSPFDFLVPLPATRALDQSLRQIPLLRFTPHWAGLATTHRPYAMEQSQAGPFFQLVQRSGEPPAECRFKALLSTRADHEVDQLTVDFPKRWHVEEFFNARQALGWQRAGTLNLNIRHGQISMALLAQAALLKVQGPLAV